MKAMGGGSGAPTGSRKTLDHLDDLVPPEPLEASELNQFPNLAHRGTLLRSTGNGHPSTSLRIEEAFVSKEV